MDKNSQPLFGIAGFPPAFFNSAYSKKRENIFEWTKSIGLNWVELQNTYGVKMKRTQAELYKQLAEENEIGISLHAPYYISLASGDPAVVERSKDRMRQCFELAEMIGSQRIIFHPGFFPGDTEGARRSGVEQIITALSSLETEVPTGVMVYPETAGKRSQIGSVSEIIEICHNVKFALPCIDLAHVHGFNGGTLKSTDAILKVLDNIELSLGTDTLSRVHFHMYPVEIDHNGEKRHKAFGDIIKEPQISFFNEGDNKYYPTAENFVDAIRLKKINPVVICEAHDTQDEGALLMKSLFYN